MSKGLFTTFSLQYIKCELSQHLLGLALDMSYQESLLMQQHRVVPVRVAPFRFLRCPHWGHGFVGLAGLSSVILSSVTIIRACDCGLIVTSESGGEAQ